MKEIKDDFYGEIIKIAKQIKEQKEKKRKEEHPDGRDR